jgi:hypothetical protein
VTGSPPGACCGGSTRAHPQTAASPGTDVRQTHQQREELDAIAVSLNNKDDHDVEEQATQCVDMMMR